MISRCNQSSDSPRHRMARVPAVSVAPPTARTPQLISQAVERTGGWVAAHPVASVIAAVAAGVVLGWWVKRK